MEFFVDPPIENTKFRYSKRSKGKWPFMANPAVMESPRAATT